jgi:hypothetical protein
LAASCAPRVGFGRRGAQNDSLRIFSLAAKNSRLCSRGFLGFNRPGATLTARFGRRRFYSGLMIWAAVVVQLHLLVVQDLHHHGAEGPPAGSRRACALTAGGGPQIQVAQSQGSPLCAACQITRNGSVQVQPSNLTPFQSVQFGAVALTSALDFHPVPQLILTGRDPPLFS